MMFVDRLRRYFERRGYALLPWTQFAEMTAERQRLLDEIDRLQRAERLATDEHQRVVEQVAVLENTLRVHAQEVDSWRTTCALRAATHGDGVGLPQSDGDRAAIESRLLERLMLSGVPADGVPVYLH